MDTYATICSFPRARLSAVAGKLSRRRGSRPGPIVRTGNSSVSFYVARIITVTSAHLERADRFGAPGTRPVSIPEIWYVSPLPRFLPELD